MKFPLAVPSRPWSLTARLISLQVLALALLLGGALILIYNHVSADLETDNRTEFTSEIKLLARWLADSGDDPRSPAASRKTRDEFLAALPVFVRLLGTDGRVRLENRPQVGVPRNAFPDPGQPPVAWRAPDHRRFLLGSARLEPAGGDSGLLLQMAYDVSDDDTLLRHLRQQVGLLFGLAIVISGVLAWLIARGVFRPLARLTAAAARVHASQLDGRIQEEGWPAELTALAQEFDAMLARLDESFRRLARFSSDLSHELRTPINNLRGEAEVALSRPRREEEYRRVLESGLEECARIGRLIDTLLFIAKSDHPAQGINRRTLDAAAECRAVAEFFEAQAAERNLSIQVRGAAPVHCDPELLRRALANLVDNATRHTAAGGRVDMVVRDNPGRGTEIEVSDTGTGIPAEHLSRVFERFYRSERSPGEADTPSGFGLGLAIVKSIMDLHGGTVSITSVPGRGTTVTLFFSGYAAAS